MNADKAEKIFIFCALMFFIIMMASCIIFTSIACWDKHLKHQAEIAKIRNNHD